MTLFALKWLLAILTIALLTASISLSGMKTPGSLRQLTLKWNLLFFLGAACLISLINIQTHQRQVEISTQQLEQELRTNAREQVKRRALLVHDLINNEIDQSKVQLRNQLTNIVNQATSTAAHLYHAYQDQLSEKELRTLILKSLSSTQYNNGRGYLFALQLDGVELPLSPHTLQTGGKILSLQDKGGKYFATEMIDLVNTHGDGFVSYHIKKPNQNNTEHEKLSYVRFSEPLNCLIGAGEYLDDHQRETQEKIFSRLNGLSREDVISVFGASYAGVSLFGPGQGQNQLNIQDRGGLYIVQEFIALARSGGGFLNYQMPDSIAPESYDKVSYCVAIEEWDSYVGAGINLESVDKKITLAHANLKRNIYQQLYQSAIFVCIATLLLWYMSRRFSITIEQNVTSLTQSLQNAATSNQYLNLDAIHIDEFNIIGQTANLMLLEQHKAENTLYESEARFRAALERAPLLVALLDAQQNVTFGNVLWFNAIGQMAPVAGQPLLQQLLDAKQYDRLKLAFDQLVQRHKPYKNLDVSFLNATAERIDLELSLVAIPDTKDHNVSVLLMAKDVTASRASERKLKWIAHNDHLTGLANRYSCVEQLETLRQRPQAATTFWLFMVDLNRFQHINDAYGHDAGDYVLKEVAKRLLKTTHPPLLVARQSSDEFILAMALTDDTTPKIIATRIYQEITKPLYYNKEKFHITSCIGAAPFAQSSVDQLLQQVDIAVRTCKGHQNNINYVEYDDELEQTFQKEQQLEAALQLALQSPDQLELNFQPIWDLTHSTLQGFEALIRWHHPTLGSISPAVFIPFAEQRSLIIPLGKHIFELACQTLQRWVKNDPQLVGDAIRLSVNMAPQQFMTDTFISDIQAVIDHYEIPAKLLCIEITETSLMESPELAAQQIKALKQMGIVIAIDDFGTGYSSLAYLNQFDVDTIKIDRSLVETIANDHSVAKISEALINLAHDLNLKVTAEGIENHDQLNYLKQLSCDTIQGFLVGKPQSETRAEMLLLERKIPWSNQNIGG